MNRAKPSGRRRWYMLLVVALAALGAGCVLLWLRVARDPLATATDAYRRGDWNAADRLAAARLKSSPDDREAVRLAARFAARLGHDMTARRLYTRLGGPAAMEAEDFWLFGTIIDRLGHRETAMDSWIEGLRADPNHPELLREIVLDDLATGKPIQAGRFARRLSAQPGWEARGNILLGQALAADDDPAGAADCWSRTLERDPSVIGQSSGLRTAMARAYLRIGRSSEARAVLQASSERSPDPETSWLLSRSDLQERNPAGAKERLAAGQVYRDGHPLEPDPSPYVGSARCRECHHQISESVRHSQHARTFQRSPEIDVRASLDQTLKDPGDPAVQHSIQRVGGELRYQMRQQDRVVSAVLEYAFGSGDRGMTLVGRDDRGRTRECRLSTYKDGTIWDVTTGQMSPPRAGADFLGRGLADDELRSCFFCHATVARTARDRTGPESADPGIGCERCHGPGGNHLIAVSLGFRDLSIARPRPESGAQAVALCAGCHRPLGMKVTRTDALAPRFPAVSLTWTRCYIESKAAIDCLTCHDPHRDAEKSPAYFEQKCLECHSHRSSPAASRDDSTASPASCPVNPLRGCLECHMPVVENVVAHTSFTDHDIRVRPEKRTRAQ